MDLRNVLPMNLFEVIDRAGISTSKEILTLSVWDIKRLTKLHLRDIQLLKNMISDHVNSKSRTCKELLEKKSDRINSGCTRIDTILGGGFRRGTLTEIFGESGSGKTQLALQTVIQNLPKFSVYICTEDLFPVKRFNQIINSTKGTTNIDYGKNVFVEHISEANDFLICIRVRLPKLLEIKSVSLIIIDSVAAPFRVESTNYVKRAEDIREFATLLIGLAQQYNVAIICINQVTSAFDETDTVHPALGLAWSNMVSTRLRISKTAQTVSVDCNSDKSICNDQGTFVIRDISVIFAPDLDNSSASFVITSKGIQTVN